MDFKFHPKEPAFPIEVFISIVEHEAKTSSLDDKGTVSLMLSHLSPKNVNGFDFQNTSNWSDLKVQLIQSFSQQYVNTQQKLDSLLSLHKKPMENCYHFFLRCQHVAKLVHNINEWTEILFLMGLSHDERSIFDIENPPKIEEICHAINEYNLTEKKLRETSEIVIKSENIQYKEEFETYRNDQLTDPYRVQSDIDVALLPTTSFRGEQESYDNNEEKKIEVKMEADSEWENTEGKSLKRGIKTKSKKETVQCTICKETIPKWGSKRHYAKVHGTNQHFVPGTNLKCSQCDQLFPSPYRLSLHMRNIHSTKFQILEEREAKGEVLIIRNPERIPLLRPIEPTNLTGEEKKDGKRVLNKLKCALCPAVIEGNSNFVSHLNEAHEGKKYGCDQCDYTTKKTRDLLQHRLAIHNMFWGNGSIFVCRINGCGMKKINVDEFLLHLKTHDTTERLFECNVCGKSFKTKLIMDQHVKLSHLMVIKPYPCQVEGCNFSTHSPKLLDNHMEVHRDPSERLNIVVCQQCGMCVNQKNLNRHVRTVHLKEKNFPCEDCNMTFFDASSRRKHYKNVHEEKTMVCPKCNKGFGNRSNYLRHIKVQHMDAKRFRCTICNQEFRESCNLSYHVGRKHMGFSDEEAKAKRHLARQHPAFQKID